MIAVESKVWLWEIDGKKVPHDKEEILSVLSHVNECIILEYQGGKLAVKGKDLIEAIKNALNTGE